MFTFAGAIGSCITEDLELVERDLDFHPIEDKEHEGEYAGAFMAKRLSELQGYSITLPPTMASFESFPKHPEKEDEDEDPEVEVMTEMAEDLANLSPSQKLRMITTKICASPQRRRRFKLTAASVYKEQLHTSGRKLSTLMVTHDVKHRWNFTEAMISRALLAIPRGMGERDEF
ncbi:hypothetical protein B0H19DRAFT_1274494 [Mycena capillaripes]|nr:hypothetical protein B0H19DRAFT_1274494 [Mycena capillaripes]